MSQTNQKEFEKVLSDRNHVDYQAYLWILNNKTIIEAGMQHMRNIDYLDAEEFDELDEQLEDILSERAKLNDKLLNMVAQLPIPTLTGERSAEVSE